jgi:CRISPR system Cascade subunit CasA
MSEFNLLTEPWISCIMLDGSKKELGIKDTLMRADEILEIFDQSPLTAPAIMRLLLVILHRNFGPATINEWGSIWAKKRFDFKKLEGYLTEWNNRFYLLDERYPFYQRPDIEYSKRTPISKLSHDIASAHNPALFDHSSDDTPALVSLHQAARLLVTMQPFAIGGGKSQTSNFMHGTMVGGAIVMLKGSTLFETLMLNLVQYSPLYNIPYPSMDDLPVWEREKLEEEGSDKLPSGLLDYLTWQSRAIRLLPEKVDSCMFVREVYLSQGIGMLDDEHIFKEPSMCHRKVEKQGWLKLRIDPEKDIWRDLHSLLLIPSDSLSPPLCFKWISHAVDEGYLTSESRYNIEISGLATSKAKIELWHHSKVPFSLEYLNNHDLILKIGDAITKCESGSKVLKDSVFILSKHYLSFQDDRNPDLGAVRTHQESFDVMRYYWSRMEVPFYQLMDELPSIYRSDSSLKKVDERIIQWSDQNIIPHAKDSFEMCVKALPVNARSLKGSVIAGEHFNRKIQSI